MKKIIAALLAAALAGLCLSACNVQTADGANGTEGLGNQKNAAGKRLHIVATTFPEYDWVRQILGDAADGVELTLLLADGVDLHSYQPSVGDIAKIANCDLFLHVGGPSDGWVHDALQTGGNPERTVINLLEVLGEAVKGEEIVEGMQHEDGHGHSHDEDDHDDDGHAREEAYGKAAAGGGASVADEHVWLSLKNARTVSSHIAEVLERIDPDHAPVYAKNAEAYVGELEALDAAYRETVAHAQNRVLVFGDRFPFRYLTDDYGIDYYAAFPGCSADTEASFETVVFLAQKTNALGLRYLLVTESSDLALANTIKENTDGRDQEILSLNAMQSVKAEDIASGATYLSIMEQNLAVLKKALS